MAMRADFSEDLMLAKRIAAGDIEATESFVEVSY